MNKLKNNSILLVAVAFIVALSACSMMDNDLDNDSAPNLLFISPISEGVTKQVNVSWDSSTTLIVSVALHEPVGDDLSATIGQNNDLVSSYNSNNDLDYAELPSDALTFSTKNPAIASGQKASDPVEISLNMQFLEENTSYLLPIEITGTTGATVGISEVMNVKYYVLDVESKS